MTRRSMRIGIGTLLVAGLAGCHSSPSSPLPAADSGSACTIAPPTAPDWHLVADGTNLRDGLGRVVFLRGVDSGERSKFAPYVPFDYPDGGFATELDTYMDLAASWGIDVIRLAFTWAALQPTEGVNDPDWLSRYDQLIDAAWARGIWTILDFHQDIYSEVLCGDGFPGWTVPDAGPPKHDCAGWSFAYFDEDSGVPEAFDRFWDAGSPVQAQYVTVWDFMIARYKDRPGVVGFEPFNEPGWGSANEPTFSATTLTQFYSMMVPHMRTAAPTSLVFVDSPGIDGTNLTTALGKPTGDGIVFAPHYYPISAGLADPPTDLTVWQGIGATWNVPVYVGEFGASPVANVAANVAYVSSVFDALDLLSLSGSEWEYGIASEEWNFQQFSVVASDGGEYPLAQAVQRPYARAIAAIAGSAITQHFDTTSNTFTLSYTPTTSGVSEVAIPAHLYPAGYETVVTGACADQTSEPGRLLLQTSPGATTVSLTITAK
jgi:endoglycosylceramidase